MRLEFWDWAIVAFVMAFSIVVSVSVRQQASKSADEFFLSGRSMPWWLLGASMVATTFSTDTPNLVADITRTRGVAGNWIWWAFLLTGMATAFFFARCWRRSGVATDIEFYELRYSGSIAAFLRIFRAVYLGLVFNVLIMAAVTLAAIKFGTILLGVTPLQVVLVAGSVTLLFSIVGGLKGVLIADMFLFFLAMIGAVAAAYFAVNLPEVGGLSGLFSHPAVESKSALLPSLSDPDSFIPLLLIPLVVQWWSVWYPGAEPGGGGYVAQRMLAAKNENNALGAVLLFNFAHYALRPWPWILVALASLIVFPDLESLRVAFPDVDSSVVGHDLAYPAMLTFVPSGWLGAVVASLLAAYMSTISTSLNLGSSYFTNDVYRRFINPQAEPKRLVTIGRIAMAGIMLLAGFLALQLQSALQTFNLLLSIGAGTGLLFILRWYWDRINAWSEISAMVISFVISVFMQLSDFPTLEDWHKLVISIAITTVGWIAVTLLTPREDAEKLVAFYNKIQPRGPGWEWTKAQPRAIKQRDRSGQTLHISLLCMILACISVYTTMFAIGRFLQANMQFGFVALVVAIASSAACFYYWQKHFSAAVMKRAIDLQQG